MQVSTGQTWTDVSLVPSTVTASDLVMVTGSPAAIASLSQACRQNAARRGKSQTRRQMQRASRRKNR